MAPVLSENILRVSERDALVDFYTRAFGMQVEALDESRVRLAFEPRANGHCALELWDSLATGLDFQRATYDRSSGYWKIGITDSKIDVLRHSLESQGWPVSNPHQFLDIGYLCHLQDPDGFCIELLNHQFNPPLAPLAAGVTRTLGQITLRVVDIGASLDFYQNVMGMRLLSRQEVSEHGFSLYFLASTKERPPNSDLDGVENREWLWQRPFTCLELQHFHQPIRMPEGYRKYHAAEHGFWGLGFRVADVAVFGSHRTVQAWRVNEECPALIEAIDYAIVLVDPDGYLVRVAAE